MTTTSKRRTPTYQTSGTAVIYPRGVEQRQGVHFTTRWRWEREGVLPPRDVFRAGRAVGWRHETIEAWERGAVQAPAV